MAIVINSNFSARQIQQQLNQSTAATQKVVTQMSSGKKLVSPMDGGGDIAVAHKLASAMRRNEATTQGVQNARSYLETQQGGLKVLGDILNRMRELHTNYRDVSKNDKDRENYNYEFKELTKQLTVLSKEKFNGVSLFSDLSSYITGSSDLKVNLDETGNEIATFKKPVLEGTLIDNILLYGEDKGLSIFDDTSSKQKDQFTISGSVAKDDKFSFKFQFADIKNGQHISETISYTATAADEAAANPQQSVRDALVALANAKISKVATISNNSTNGFIIEGIDTTKVFKVSEVSSSNTKASYLHTTVKENKNGQLLSLAGSVEAGNIFSVNLTDQDGNNVTVSTDPLSAGSTIQTVRDALVAKINTTANLDVTAEAGTAPEDIIFSPNGLVKTNANGAEVVIVIDESGSTKSNGAMPAQKNAIKALVDYYNDLGLGDKINVSIVSFSNGYRQRDMNPSTTSTIENFALANADLDGNGTFDIKEVADGGFTGGGTNFAAGLQGALNVFNSLGTTTKEKNLIFLSDGEDFGSSTQRKAIADQIKALGVNIRAFGVGSGAKKSDFADLDDDAVVLSDVNEIVNVFAGKKSGFDVNSVNKTGSAGSSSKTTNGVTPVAQEDTLSITAGTVNAGDTFSVSIGGVSVSTGPLAAGASLADIRAALVSQINATAGVPATAVNGTNANEIKLTSKTAGTAFTTSNPATTATGAALAAATTKANLAGVKEVHTVTLAAGTILAGDFFYMDIDGTTVKTDPLVAGNTATDARNALIGKINAAGLAVTATANGADSILVTANVDGATHQVGPDVWKNSPAGALNAGLSQAQVDKITISPDTNGEIAKGDIFNFSVDGTAFAYTAAAGDSAQTVRDYFVAQINGAALKVTAAAVGTNAFTITANTVGDGFIITKSIPNAADSFSVSHLSFANPLNSLDLLTNYLAQNGSASARLIQSRNLNTQNMIDHEKSLGLIEGLDYAKASTMLAKVTAFNQMGIMMLAQANKGANLTLVVMSLA